jgi:hypothetical protein
MKSEQRDSLPARTDIRPATPLPWTATQGHIYPPNDDAPAIAEFASKQSARYAACAANAYPKLVEALRWMLYRFESVCPDSDGNVFPADSKRIESTRALLRELGELK